MKVPKPVAIGAVGFIAAMISVAASAIMPPVEHFGAIQYRTGGIGIDEAKAMRDEARSYPLTLEFVEQLNNKHDEYSADEHVVIENASGKTVLSAQTGGPFMLVDLPHGEYKIQASAAGHQEVRHVDLKGKAHDRVAFVWPAKEVEPKLR